QLIDKYSNRVRAVEIGGELADGLRHEAGAQTDVGVAHLAFDLGARGQRAPRVDDDDVEGAGTDEGVGDLERLLAGVGLGDQQIVDVDANCPGVDRVDGVLGVDVGADAAVALGLGNNVHRQRSFPRGLRSVYL